MKEHRERFGARFPRDEELPRWDAEFERGVLKGSVYAKARKLNKLKCVEQIAVAVYDVKPIPGYNKTTYRVDLMPESCNCQANKNGTGKTCSHIMSVHLFRKNRNLVDA